MSHKPIDTGALLNQTQMASACRVSVNAFTAWCIEPHTTTGRTKLYLVADVIENRLAQHKGKTEPDQDVRKELDIERLRLTKEQADALEIKNAIARREVAPIGFVAWFSAKLARLTGERADTLPLDLSRALRLKPQDVERTKIICTDMANAVADLGSEDITLRLINEYIDRADD